MAPQPTALDRFLNLFSEVRAGEGGKAVWLSVNVFLLLTAYYVLKPVREALILGQGSAELKSYMSAGQVALLALAVPLYGRLADALSRRKLINWVTMFFVACLVLFYLLSRVGVPLGIAFFLWIGVFNLMIVAQFWSFANVVYSKSEGERLFPIVAFGASLGAVLGAVLAAQLIEPLGLYQLMLVGAALLLAAVQITNHVDRQIRERELRVTDSHSVADLRCTDEMEVPRPDELDIEPAPPSAPSKTGAFALVFKSRYLLLIGCMLLLLNWVNTTGEYILGSVVADAAQQAVAESGGSVEEFIGGFYAAFFGVVNVVGLVIQLFVVSRVVKYLGVRIGVLALPVLSFGAYGLLAFFPVLAAVRWAKTAENATDYSLNNTVRNMLFLPTSRAEKYSAKQAIDSFFVRMGDVLSAGLVFLGTGVLALSVSGFARVNLVLVAIWFVLALLIGREYRRRSMEADRAQSG